MITRPHNWEERLITYMSDVRNQEFIWGEHDCIMAGINWLERLQPLTKDGLFIKPYATALQAQRLVRDVYGGSMSSLISGYLPVTRCHRSKASRGDLALVSENVKLPFLGIILGQQIYGPGEHNAVFLPRSASDIYYKVGE